MWQTVIDISEQLNTHMKKSKWKDVEDQAQGKRCSLDETQKKILSRSFFMATTAFVWSEAWSQIINCSLSAMRSI